MDVRKIVTFIDEVMTEGGRAVDPPGWAPPRGYANAVEARGRSVWVAGQIGWNPATAAFETDDFVEQTEQALRNVAAALRAPELDQLRGILRRRGRRAA